MCGISRWPKKCGILCTKRFTDTHDFKKPNDKTALDLMNSCAKAVRHDMI